MSISYMYEIISYIYSNFLKCVYLAKIDIDKALLIGEHLLNS